MHARTLTNLLNVLVRGILHSIWTDFLNVFARGILNGKCVKTGVKTGKFLLFFNQKERNILYKRMVWKTNFTRILYLRGKIDEKHAEIL